MYVKTILFIVCLSATISLSAQNPFAHVISGAGGMYNTEMKIDHDGNIYIAGYFIQTADFDPTSNVHALTARGNYDAFVAKYNNNGELIWVRQAGGAGNEFIYTIIVDDSGSVYTGGTFNGVAAISAGQPDSLSLTSRGIYDIFIVKYNAVGDMVWLRQAGGNKNDAIRSFAMDSNGDLLVTGSFETTTAFEMGNGVTFSNTSIDDGFIARYSGNGNLIWGKQLKGDNILFPSDIEVNSSGEILVMLDYEGTIDMDPGIGTYNFSFNSNGNNNHSCVFAKYDEHGELLWAKELRVTTGECYLRRLIIADNGDLLLAGDFSQTLDFDPGAGTFPLTSNGPLKDAFFARYTTDGNLVWARPIGGTSYDFAYGITIDSAGYIYVAGSFQNTADFDPGPGNTSVTSNGLADCYFAKYDSNGTFMWVRQVGGFGYDEGTAIALDHTGNIYLSGYFSNTVDFDPGSSVYNITSGGSTDGFFTKYNPAGHIVPEVLPVRLLDFRAAANNGKVYLNWKTASETNNAGFTIQRSTPAAQGTWEPIGFLPGLNQESVQSSYAFTDAMPPSGNIYYRLKQQDIDNRLTYSRVVAVNIGSALSFNIFPNPVISTGTITYSIPSASSVRLRILTVSGQEVTTLINSFQQRGVYAITWNTADISSGIYICQLLIGNQAETRNFVLQK